MSICIVVSDDDGARRASHALRGCGWGGVHFESNPPAALRMTSTGRATVLNASRAAEADVTTLLRELGPSVAFDWRRPPPELSEEEWAVLYNRTDELTVQKVKRRRGPRPKNLPSPTTKRLPPR